MPQVSADAYIPLTRTIAGNSTTCPAQRHGPAHGAPHHCKHQHSVPSTTAVAPRSCPAGTPSAASPCAAVLGCERRRGQARITPRGNGHTAACRPVRCTHHTLSAYHNAHLPSSATAGAAPAAQCALRTITAPPVQIRSQCALLNIHVSHATLHAPSQPHVSRATAAVPAYAALRARPRLALTYCVLELAERRQLL